MRKEEGNGRRAVSIELCKDLLGLSNCRDGVVADLDESCTLYT